MIERRPHVMTWGLFLDFFASVCYPIAMSTLLSPEIVALWVTIVLMPVAWFVRCLRTDKWNLPFEKWEFTNTRP